MHAREREHCGRFHADADPNGDEHADSDTDEHKHADSNRKSNRNGDTVTDHHPDCHGHQYSATNFDHHPNWNCYADGYHFADQDGNGHGNDDRHQYTDDDRDAVAHDHADADRNQHADHNTDRHGNVDANANAAEDSGDHRWGCGRFDHRYGGRESEPESEHVHQYLRLR
ncbi:MAG TPA: hypothetical protein VMW56_15175 [Candidatus Margulisiibacteriota bacterium]|nr:hypothetical protein [Candidatus Margulisiibacteriota bacterium]